MYYNYVKALHLIFVITWFVGLFYIPRLFIYHVEGLKKPKNEATILSAQFKIMERRLWYIITWPSAILSIIFAVWLLLHFLQILRRDRGKIIERYHIDEGNSCGDQKKMPQLFLVCQRILSF